MSIAHSLSRNFGAAFNSQILWLDNLDALLENHFGIPSNEPTNLRKIRGEGDSNRA